MKLVVYGYLVFASSVAVGDESPFHTRAVWVPPTSFATKLAADEMVARCRRAGFNVLLTDVMVNRTVWFRSKHFPGLVVADDDFDPLAYVIERAHESGIKVEAWCCIYYEGSDANAQPALHPEWLVRSMSDQPFSQRFLSPSIPAVNSYLLSVVTDLLQYDIDGIHLDYIRYPGTTFDYSSDGRAAFKAAVGFDPLDFLDHVDRIVDPGTESYPIRVLFPQDHLNKAWETTNIERTLDQTGLGYAFISESPENVSKLRVPGLLIVSSYYHMAPAMIDALADYVDRGGDLLWTNAPGAMLAKSARLRQMLGLRSAKWTGAGRFSLQPASGHPMAAALSKDAFLTTSSYSLQPDEATIAARLADGSPAIVVQTSKGRAIVVGPHLMKGKSPVVTSLVKSLVEWLRSEAITREAFTEVADPLASKRAAWIEWRAGRVTELVRAIHDAAKRHDPMITVSSSGGPSPAEFYSCYRDAGRWLAEGINDHLFPMNYTEDPVELDDMLSVQAASASRNRKSVIYPGLRAYTQQTVGDRRSIVPLDAENIERQLKIVRAHGYQGFAIFSYNTLSDKTIEVLRRASRPGDEE